MYLLDANVLINANDYYYPIDGVPEFWDWLIHQGQRGEVKICIEMYEEVTGDGPLAQWLAQDEVRNALLLPDASDPAVVAQVVDQGYAPDLSDNEIQTIGRDPFLIAHAMADLQNRIVVTSESSAPSKQRQNRKIPDICRQFGVQCCDPFALYRRLKFKTGWRLPG
jgi:hypothetical protein